MAAKKPGVSQIYQASLRFLAPLSVQETCRLVVEEAIKLVNGDSGTILLEQGSRLHRVYATDPTFYKIKPRPDGYMYSVYKTQKPLYLTKQEIKAIHPEIASTALASDVIVPLAYNGHAIGVLSIMSLKNEDLSQTDYQNLAFFAPLATLAIKKSMLYDEAKQAIENRDIFISMASHELKTPVTAIKAYLDIAYLSLDEQKNPHAQTVHKAQDELERLIKLLQELLHIDQVRTGNLWFDWKICSLREIANRATQDFALMHPNYTIVLKDNLSKSSDDIYADYDKILQIFYNILNNAAKFSPEKSTITITLKDKPPDLEISITDQGPGIPKSDLQKVFMGFYRGQSHTKEGMGLGLYLTKQIVQALKGTIDIRSKVGVGTTMIIRLPHYHDI